MKKHEGHDASWCNSTLVIRYPLQFFLITDGAANFSSAFKKEFYAINNPRTRDISHIRLQGDHNNKKMERLNGEVHDREKVMRGLKITNTPVLAGYQIYHNYFRPYMALNGKTPAQVSVINRITFIQNAKSVQNK